jgi:hypothetical protein
MGPEKSVAVEKGEMKKIAKGNTGTKRCRIKKPFGLRLEESFGVAWKVMGRMRTWRD